MENNPLIIKYNPSADGKLKRIIIVIMGKKYSICFCIIDAIPPLSLLLGSGISILVCKNWATPANTANIILGFDKSTRLKNIGLI